MHTLICLVRHGVTDWNYEGRAQGHSDIPLCREGLRQAGIVAARLAQESWAAIYSSPLQRAFQTATAIGTATGLQVVPDARLMERCCGAAEGMTLADRKFRLPGIEWNDTPGFEADEPLVDRARAALTEIATRHAGERVVCVAHGSIIHTFLSSLPVKGLARLTSWQSNTSVTMLSWDGTEFEQITPSDASHLLDHGVEYSGEKGRVRGVTLAALFGGTEASAVLDEAFSRATAVEAAWVGSRLVGLVRAFTDGVWRGYVDVIRAAPGYERVIPRLVERLEERYPDVAFTTIPAELQDITEQAG